MKSALLIIFSLALLFQGNISTAAIQVVDDDTGIDNGVSPFATIAAAITAAAVDDIIDITGGGDNIHQENGITVSKNLTIRGQGQATTIVQAAASRLTAGDLVFLVSGGVTATFQDMTVRYGNVSGNGGGISASTGSLTLTRVTVTQNDSSGGGGGIYCGGLLTMTDCAVVDNKTSTADGGGLKVVSSSNNTISFTSCTFRDNVAHNSAGAIDFFTSSSNDLTITMTNCTVYNNSSALTNASNTGAIRYEAGTSSNFTLTNCTITDNTFTTVSGSSGGGGIYAHRGTLNMTKTIVANNGPAAANGDDILMNSLVSMGTNDANIVEDCVGTPCPTWLSTADPNLMAVTTCGEQSYLEPNTGSAAIDPTSTAGESKDICQFVRDQGNVDVGSREVGATMLPIELIRFMAQKSGKDVELIWQTGFEENNSGFDIEWSIDNRTWQNISFVRGAGNTYQNQTYSFLHKKAQRGINYYRLKQMDYDGAFEYSNVVNVQFAVGSRQFAVAPNPVQDQELTLYFSEADFEEATLDIFNAVGQSVRSEVLRADQTTLQVGDLPKGMYWFSVNMAGERMTEKVIIE